MNEIKIQKELIENFRKANNMTITQFCKTCKISPNTYRKIRQTGKITKIGIVYSICEATKIRSDELLGIQIKRSR